jgi:phage shock protein C
MNEKKSNKSEVKRLYKSRKDKIIDGVCGGLAEYLGVDSTLVRILFLLGVLMNGLGLILYVLGMILVPVNPEHQNQKAKQGGAKNPTLLWGVLLIVLGLIFLSHQLGWQYQWYRSFKQFHFWGISWGTYWPLGLVLLGIVYIVYVFRSEKENKKGRSTVQKKGLFKVKEKKIIAGVCAGIGRYLNIDVTLVRILFVVLALWTDVLVWILLYLALIIILPQESTVVEKAKRDV